MNCISLSDWTRQPSRSASNVGKSNPPNAAPFVETTVTGCICRFPIKASLFLVICTSFAH
ncbi:hypothetical protein [Bartonella birtlesii]|uniref:hypothetical protein n=1 Tax=Bartonella birtlesii TaxID=111504 RepID=UPI00036939CE|nr:hypothetical protein [Bartonella birtlesii]